MEAAEIAVIPVTRATEFIRNGSTDYRALRRNHMFSVNLVSARAKFDSLQRFSMGVGILKLLWIQKIQIIMIVCPCLWITA
jgi:hypothetical protein